jgi:SAM-dependent methyltransferase
MTDAGTTVRAAIDLALAPRAAFEVIADELFGGSNQEGIAFEPGPGGRLRVDGRVAGRVIAWEPGTRIVIEWHPADWQPDETTTVEIRFDAIDAGTRVEFEHRGWGRLIADPGELAGWFAGEWLVPVMRAAGPARLGDWLTDRGARRPSGAQARATYADPLYHYPNFRVILEELALTPDNHLLEVGCGGGALLKDALRSGCRAAAVDHSPDMVRLAREANRAAVEDGRLTVTHAPADRLPFPDGTFSHAVMTGVLGFLPDPVAALAEARRVLRSGGLFVSLGSDPELKGTPGAPEPMASRLRFYSAAELKGLALAAGFETADVIIRDLGPFAREVGVPEEHLPLFEGSGATFLRARRA